MFKDRRFWFVLGILIAVVALFALPRSTTHVLPTPPAAPGGDTASRAAAESLPAREPGANPRHPEIGFRTHALLLEHFEKHGGEFHAATPEEYLRLAQTLRDHRKRGGVLEFVRNDAVTCKFDRSTGAFVAYNSDGTIRTFFKPRDGEAYFERQKTRAREAP
jgi:hypothetical protein